ncbi:MAG: chemotaxis protein CheW [Spirochaetaceae bacterium]
MSDYDDIYADDSEENEQEQHLLFLAEGVYFAIPIFTVREMLPNQNVIQLPNAPGWVRGVINVRKETFRLVDFRKRVGMNGLEDEENALIAELEQREEEHKNWIYELEDAVKNATPFTGEVDPHKCKFGQWYDTFQSDNTDVNFELKKFDKPHKAIHSTAEEALKLKEEGKIEQAMELINSRKNGELARLGELFSSVKHYIKEGRKEVIILIETDEDKFAVVVDKVEVVENLRVSEDSTLATFQKDERGFARHSKVARREKEDDIVYLVEPSWIIEGAQAVSLPEGLPE